MRQGHSEKTRRENQASDRKRYEVFQEESSDQLHTLNKFCGQL